MQDCPPGFAVASYEVIGGLLDTGSFMEVHENYAENIVVGFGRLAGRSIGIIANRDLHFEWRICLFAIH